MLETEALIAAFTTLKHQLDAYLAGQGDDFVKKTMDEAVQKSSDANVWFTPDSQEIALKAIADMLVPEALSEWVASYTGERRKVAPSKTIALILAGNIPAVGFHDFMCVLFSGHRALAKLSSDDRYLLPALFELLCRIDNRLSGSAQFTDGMLKGFDAVIATGSNNSARYFDYYFSRYPHVIRHNRNAIAILDGHETHDEFLALGKDVFTFFGLGCRSVTRLFVPVNYDFIPLLNAWSEWKTIANHARYFNNYEYNKAVFLVNNEPHFDTGFLLLAESDSIASPIGVLFYTYYTDVISLQTLVKSRADEIQCVVASERIDSFTPASIKPVPFGMAQTPAIYDYADGVDTLQFLTTL